MENEILKKYGDGKGVEKEVVLNLVEKLKKNIQLHPF